MPSAVLGVPFASGAQCIMSGNVFSGTGQYHPVGGIMFKWPNNASGNCYIGLSGGGPPLSGGFMTINSGGMALSGGFLSGQLDGFCLYPGDNYFLPKVAINNNQPGISGSYLSIFAMCDQAASGVGRLYWEIL